MRVYDLASKPALIHPLASRRCTELGSNEDPRPANRSSPAPAARQRALGGRRISRCWAAERPYYHCSRCGKGFAPHAAGRQSDRSTGFAATALVELRRRSTLLDELSRSAADRQAAKPRHPKMSPAKNKPRSRASYQNWSFLRCQSPETPILYQYEMDGTGVLGRPPPRRPAARVRTAARPARATLLGCAFTQTSWTNKPSCATKTRPATPARSRTPPPSDVRIYSEAWRRGRSRARKKVVLGDGAGWIWNLSHEYFPGRDRDRRLVSRSRTSVGAGAKRFPNNKSASAVERGACRKSSTRGASSNWVTALREIETDDPECAHPLALEAD